MNMDGIEQQSNQDTKAKTAGERGFQTRIGFIFTNGEAGIATEDGQSLAPPSQNPEVGGGLALPAVFLVLEHFQKNCSHSVGAERQRIFWVLASFSLSHRPLRA